MRRSPVEFGSLSMFILLLTQVLWTKILHQLRLVGFFPIINPGFIYIPGGDRRISEPSTSISDFNSCQAPPPGPLAGCAPMWGTFDLFTFSSICFWAAWVEEK